MKFGILPILNKSLVEDPIRSTLLTGTSQRFKNICHLCCHITLTRYITKATYAYARGVRIGCFKAGGSLATLHILGGVVRYLCVL